MNNWQKVRLKDVVSILGDGLHGTPKYDEAGEYFFINGNNLSDGQIKIKSDTKRVNVSEYLKHKKDLNDRTLLVSINGTIGNVATYKGEKCILGKSACYFNILPGVCKEYIYYILLHDNFQSYAKNWATGTTIKNVSLKQMREYEFLLPSFEKQQQITKILSSLDDKIELNAQINHNLEEQAKCLVKSWFVDFEPYGGQIPDSWHEITLSEIADFIGGYSYKGAELQPSSCAMATIKNFDRTGGFKLDGYKEIIPSDKLKDSQKVELFDILVAHTDLTQKAEVIGNAEMVLSKSGYDEIIMSMDLVKVLPKHGISRFVLAALLRTDQFKDHALGYVNGTTVLHMSKKALPAFTLYFPEKFSELSEISCMLEAIYKKIAQNIEESRSLVKLRDTLLLKLMSGEIDVSEVKI